MSEGSTSSASSAADSGASGDFRNLFGARVLQPLDMDETQLKFAIDFTREQLKGCDDWQAQGDAVVDAVKQEFDRRYGPSWHCVIGKHFGSKVTHDSRQFCFFYVEDKAVLLFRCG